MNRDLAGQVAQVIGLCHDDAGALGEASPGGVQGVAVLDAGGAVDRGLLIGVRVELRELGGVVAL